MSGHSKWSTIKHQKEAKDLARGKLFSRLAKAISIAVKAGGGADPESNYKLRVAIDSAKQANMPKQNIDRAISKGASSSESLTEVTYEGYGPEGIAVLVEVATDNRNRTAQEIKNIFERSGGGLAGPGAVSYLFKHQGHISVKKTADPETQMLAIIELGVEDFQETPESLEIYLSPHLLFDLQPKLAALGFIITKSELIYKPQNMIKISIPSQITKINSFLDNLENHEDVQNIFINADLS